MTRAERVKHALANHAQTLSRKHHHRAHTQPGHHFIPASLQKPGIPAQQMQRTGTRERACGSGTGQTPLAEYRNTPRNLTASRGKAEYGDPRLEGELWAPSAVVAADGIDDASGYLLGCACGLGHPHPQDDAIGCGRSSKLVVERAG